MKKLLLLAVCLVTINGCSKAFKVASVTLDGCTAGYTALKVANQVSKVGALGGIPQAGAINAKQVRAVNAAQNVAGASGVPLGVASRLLPALIK